MKKTTWSRRDFIRTNSMAGLTAALGMGLAPSLLGSGRGSALNQSGREPALYFDAFTEIGPRRHKPIQQQWSLNHLLAEMQHCSISGALVAYTQSLLYDPMFGNRELIRMIADHPNLFPVWNVMPHQSGEFPEPEELGRLMDENRVRAVTIYPRSNSWSWQADHSRVLLDWLSEQKILTIVTPAELGDWSDVSEFLHRFPDLPVLLRDTVWSQQRYVLPLLETHRNLHISFERLQINEGVEHVYKSGYSDRILFVSNAPTMSAGAHRTYLDYADIPDEARSQMAGGNLTRLLKGLEPPAAVDNRDEDELMAAVRRGQPVDAALLDMHMHILHEGLHGAGSTGYRMQNGDPEGVFNLVGRLGYNGGGIMSWDGVVSANAVSGNRAVEAALDLAPRGYWGLATFDPVHYTQSQLERMIPEQYADRRFIGMKPYSFYGVPFHDPKYDVWWEYGNEHGLYGLIHYSRPDHSEVQNLAGRFTNARWVIAHAGGNWNHSDRIISIMNSHSNVYGEVTLTPVHLGMIEYLVEGAGADRIMYGSDLPMRDPRQQLGWVVFSRLPVEVKRQILGRNAYKMIERNLPHLPEKSRPRL